MKKQQWVQRGKQALGNAACDPYKLFLIHTAVSVGAMLLVVLINYLLGGQIEASDGLGSMGARSILQTVQLVLSEVVSLLLPLWELGAIYIAIRIFRGENAEIADLSVGFRRLWAVVRTLLLEMAVYLVVSMAIVYALSIAYALTPFGKDLMELMDGYMQITTEEELMALMQDEAFYEAMMQAMMPVLILSGFVAAGACGFVSYAIRLMRYVVLDQNFGPWQALKWSIGHTNGAKKELFKLDLHFWWYYALQVVLTLVLYVPELSAYLGLQLPMNADTAYWLCYGLYAAGQVALLSLARPQVEVAFAAAYDALKAE